MDGKVSEGHSSYTQTHVATSMLLKARAQGLIRPIICLYFFLDSQLKDLQV